jgi:hypothetical protein
MVDGAQRGLPIVRIGRRVMVRREVVEQIAAHGWTRPDGSVPLRLVEHGRQHMSRPACQLSLADGQR